MIENGSSTRASLYIDAYAGKEHMDYMIYAKLEQNGAEEIVLMFPKSLAVSSDYPPRSWLSCNTWRNVLTD